MSTAVGDEGGFAPSVASHEAAIQLILEAIDKAGYKAGEQIAIGLDCAASEFYKDGKYVLGGEGAEPDAPKSGPTCWPPGATSTRSSASRTAWPKATGTAGSTCTERLGTKVQLVGDDLFVTNTKILKEGIDKGIANSILIKINQIGTLTETFAAIEMAKRAGYTAVISHRSGETEDSTIADIAVGTNAGQIKTGSMSRSRPHRQVQPAAAHRGRPGRRRQLPGPRRVLQPAPRASESRPGRVRAGAGWPGRLRGRAARQGARQPARFRPHLRCRA